MPCCSFVCFSSCATLQSTRSTSGLRYDCEPNSPHLTHGDILDGVRSETAHSPSLKVLWHTLLATTLSYTVVVMLWHMLL